MTVPDVGQTLRDARQRRQLTIEQLSIETTIPVRDIEALEAGQVEQLPRAMYRRAEIRAYAEAVGLDPEVVLMHLRSEPHGGHRSPATHAGCARLGEHDTIDGGVAAPEAPTPPVAALEVIPLRVTALAPSASPRRRDASMAPRKAAMGPTTAVRAGRAVVVLIIGCAGMLWEQAGAPSLQMPMAPAATIPALDPQSLIDEAVRIAEPPPTPPTLRRALFEPNRPATGTQWPTNFRLDEGVLVVHSTPRGARVTVNGVGWGVTPVAIRYLPFGALKVRVGKADHVIQERVVRLSPDQPSSTLRVTLPALARRRAAAPPTIPGDMLVITTEPAGARVTVNGIGWGTTPVSISHLPSGVQRVRVVKDQFKSEERVVTVREGHAGNIAITLKPAS
jgi:hypothetical protein